MEPLHFVPIHVCVSAFTVSSSILIPMLLVGLRLIFSNKSSDHIVLSSYIVVTWNCRCE